MVSRPRRAASSRTAGDTPCAEKTTHAPSGTSDSSSTNTAPRRSRSATTCVLCTICLRTYTGAPRWPSTFSTISMARSTPAQNDLGPASSTRRGPATPAHRASTGLAARRARSAASPPVTIRGLSNGRVGVSDTARSTATGRSPAAAASGADSMSASSAPPAASRCRAAAPPARRSTVTTGPATARSPARRSSPASSGAAAHRVVPCPSLTSVPTTRSPGARSAVSPPPTPAMASTPKSAADRACACRRERAGPYPVTRTLPPAGTGRPRRTALASSRSGEHTSRVLICLPPSRALRMVVPEARNRVVREAGPRHRDTTTAPGAASCRRRAGEHRVAFGPAPAACNCWRLTEDFSWRPRQVPAKRADREHEPVEVVVEVEVTRETGPGELGLVPGPVASLVLGEPPHPGLHGRPGTPGREQRQQRPRGLRRGGGAAPRQGRVVVGAHVLAPAAVGVLMLLQPGHRAADDRLARLHPGGDERGHHRSGAVHVVRAPPAEPRAVGLLGPQ